VSRVTRLRVRVPVQIYFFSKTLKPAPYVKGYGGGGAVGLTAQPNTVSRLRMNGVAHALSLYAFTVCRETALLYLTYTLLRIHFNIIPGVIIG
jgi:hypothetical protein